uniref:Uncharacterized protein n=1 Tax=Cacopsylla melanoneura TaxID=428564 RepID=A0A8D9AN38_9HEMI
MRNINRKTWRSSCRELFKDQGILTLYGLYYLEVMITMKTNYEQNTIKMKNNTIYNTRQNNMGLIDIDRHRTAFYETNYLYKGSRWWNILPLEIKKMKMQNYKEHVKKIAIENVPYSLKEIDQINYR